MVARIACMALAMGILVGCYDVPTPDCGFACGPAGACPSSYACNASTNRCEREGAMPICDPAARTDAGPDADVGGPRLVAVIPGDTATDVSVLDPVIARFDRPLDPSTLDSMTFRVELAGTPIAGTVTYTPTIDSATFQPSFELQVCSEYRATVTSGIKDLLGKPLASEYSWTFDTQGDCTAPSVSSRSPTDTATNVNVLTAVTVTFSEPVFDVAGNFTLSAGAMSVPGAVTMTTATTARFTPTAPLASSTTYTARLLGGSIRDASFNFLNFDSWSFTTAPDTTPPVVFSTSPADTATNVPTTSTIVVQFDEPVLNVTTASFLVNSGAITGTIAMTAGNTIATFTPDAALPAATTIIVDLTSAITDTASNAFSQVSFSFATEP